MTSNLLPWTMKLFHMESALKGRICFLLKVNPKILFFFRYNSTGKRGKMKMTEKLSLKLDPYILTLLHSDWPNSMEFGHSECNMQFGLSAIRSRCTETLQKEYTLT